MHVYNSLADLAGLVPPPAPEAEKPVPAARIYDCTGCHFVDSHGLVCGACLRKILDSQAGQRNASLIAACCEGRGCISKLGLTMPLPGITAAGTSLFFMRTWSECCSQNRQA